MKYSWMIIVSMLVCLSVSGEVTKDQLKELKNIIAIDAVRDDEGRGKNIGNHVLRVEFSSEKTGLERVNIRVALEITDKKSRTAYFAEQTKGFVNMPSEDAYQGEGKWDFTIPYDKAMKLKVTAYVVEFGVMDGNEFVPFEAKYDHVKSYAELKERTLQAFPKKCQLARTVMVGDDFFD